MDFFFYVNIFVGFKKLFFIRFVFVSVLDLLEFVCVARCLIWFGVVNGDFGFFFGCSGRF